MLNSAGYEFVPGRGHLYATVYGTGSCRAHDATLTPYCDVVANALPEWCSDSWCYVDPANCAFPAAGSSYFPTLHYSYRTCGDTNTFNSFFDASTTSTGAHAITDIADVIQSYLVSVSNAMENNYHEIGGATCDDIPLACACPNCVDNGGIWGQAIDVQTATFWQRPGSSGSSDAARIDKCLAASAENTLRRPSLSPTSAHQIPARNR